MRQKFVRKNTKRSVDPGYEYAEGLAFQIKVARRQKRQYPKRDHFAAPFNQELSVALRALENGITNKLFGLPTSKRRVMTQTMTQTRAV
jgi:hypothetical protein